MLELMENQLLIQQYAIEEYVREFTEKQMGSTGKNEKKKLNK